MIPRKPKFDERTREDIALYSTDDLRACITRRKTPSLSDCGTASRRVTN
jgi:hypothetical protein